MKASTAPGEALEKAIRGAAAMGLDKVQIKGRLSGTGFRHGPDPRHLGGRRECDE